MEIVGKLADGGAIVHLTEGEFWGLQRLMEVSQGIGMDSSWYTQYHRIDPEAVSGAFAAVYYWMENNRNVEELEKLLSQLHKMLGRENDNE